MASKKKSSASKKKAAPAARKAKAVKKPAPKAKTAKKPQPKAKPAVKKAPAKKAPAKAKAVVKAKPVAKTAKKPAATAVAPVKKSAPAKAPAAAKPPKTAGINDKPIIRTGPSIAPRNLGVNPLQALRGAPPKNKGAKEKPLSAKEIDLHRDMLFKLRDRVIDEISFLANDNLNKSSKDASGDLSSYSFHMADQGTDNFDREFAASLLNSEHDVLYEIEEALRRIEQGTYGICEQSGEPIERERLRALPFARYCVAVQAEIERGKPKYRPFRRTSIQGADAM
jgi:RNA polymerase-binding transcription factor DksA